MNVIYNTVKNMLQVNYINCINFKGLLNLSFEQIRVLTNHFPFSWFWNSVIINIPLASGTEEVATVGMVACMANSSRVSCYHTRL